MSTINNKLIEALKECVEDIERMVPKAYNLNPAKYSTVIKAKEVLAEAEQQEQPDVSGVTSEKLYEECILCMQGLSILEEERAEYDRAVEVLKELRNEVKDFDKMYNTACSKIDELNEELAILKEKKETTGSGVWSNGITDPPQEI